jgi:hypothetical protein
MTFFRQAAPYRIKSVPLFYRIIARTVRDKIWLCLPGAGQAPEMRSKEPREKHFSDDEETHVGIGTFLAVNRIG